MAVISLKNSYLSNIIFEYISQRFQHSKIVENCGLFYQKSSRYILKINWEKLYVTGNLIKNISDNILYKRFSLFRYISKNYPRFVPDSVIGFISKA